jgi:hypothetical protein
MVEIHNFLNEETWQEVLKLEKRSNRYIFISLSGAYIGHLAVMRNLTLPNLKDGLVRCHQRRVSGYLRDGCYHSGSSEQLFNMS